MNTSLQKQCPVTSSIVAISFIVAPVCRVMGTLFPEEVFKGCEQHKQNPTKPHCIELAAQISVTDISTPLSVRQYIVVPFG